ncbi:MULTISPECIES: hypothetical protein [unclassified Moorena]|uniref:hypothetical protein n=1 Tax=unclassified Moorena TaxID=2683338 RepID=UPI0013FECBC1|nr:MULTISPECIES: hypothetical protein [unclassified Moorena]NEO14251.1 hypothetical protein [Moorena sp. SIO3E8]NEQ00199.1 hypothetical protein [Moorena sp. SIO3F7]
MTIDIENMENKMNSLVYEEPTLKNYGTMKSLTLAAAGSSGDNMGLSNGGNSALIDNAINDGGTAGGPGDPADFPADAHNGTGFQSDPDS